jgi:ribonucleoside-diphosphate reductase alpha chain
MNQEVTRDTDISQDVLAQKYLFGDEQTPDDVYRRVSKAIGGVEKTLVGQQHWTEKFLKNMRAGAIGAGRIMASAGTGRQATLINCFVVPVADAASNGTPKEPAIWEALAFAAETMRRGGGVGFNFGRGALNRFAGKWPIGLH